jgi:hypothetical protein
MYFSHALLVGASLVASVVAQTGRIAFTRLPDAVVTAGQPVELAWSGGDGKSVSSGKHQATDSRTTANRIPGDLARNHHPQARRVDQPGNRRDHHW